MLERNPTRRKEGFEKVRNDLIPLVYNCYFQMLPCTSEMFPAIFESFLYRYMKEFQATMEPDDIVTK